MPPGLPGSSERAFTALTAVKPCLLYTSTRKVICEHSTIGLVVTTDGSISDIPRSGYEKAEERVIEELEAIQKPFIILLNCVAPESLESMTLAEEPVSYTHLDNGAAAYIHTPCRSSLSLPAH